MVAASRIQLCNERRTQKRKVLIMMLMAIVWRKKREMDMKKRCSRDKATTLKRNLLNIFKEKCKLMRTDSQFSQNQYGIPSDVFSRIAEAVRLEIPRNWNSLFDEFDIATIYLDYVVSGISARRLAKFTGVSPSTIGWMIRSTCSAINNHLYCIETPKVPEEWKRVEDGFLSKGLLRTIGSLDGKHVKIKPPAGSGTLFFNYKSAFSIVLLALVDSDRRFLWVDVGCPGSTNDACIFNDSSLKKIIENPANLPPPSLLEKDSPLSPLPSFILADGIFKLTDFCMKPFSHQSQSPTEIIYNKQLSKTRVYVEHSFGLISSKFRCLLSPLDSNLCTTKALILSICNLHNMITPKSSHRVFERYYDNCTTYQNPKEMRNILKLYLNQ